MEEQEPLLHHMLEEVEIVEEVVVVVLHLIRDKLMVGQVSKIHI